MTEFSNMNGMLWKMWNLRALNKRGNRLASAAVM